MDKYTKFYLDLAILASRNSVCVRHKVGCVLVKNTNILSVGWNGTTTRFHTNLCENYIEGKLVTIPWTVHAEANAIAKCAKLGIATEGSTAYITIPPCESCAGLLKQSGIVKVVYIWEYKSSETIPTLKTLGIETICVSPEKLDHSVENELVFFGKKSL